MPTCVFLSLFGLLQLHLLQYSLVIPGFVALVSMLTFASLLLFKILSCVILTEVYLTRLSAPVLLVLL